MLACGFGLCPKVGHEQSNPPANGQEVLDSTQALQPDSSASGSQTGARQGVEDHARTFSPWSQVVRLLYAQLMHALGLNDVCDALRLVSGPLSRLCAGRC